MAEYLIQDTTLTNLGDKIRVLTGTEGTMTPAEMQTDLDTFNTDMGTIVTEQDDLIAQLQTLASTKAAFNTVYVGTTAPTDDIGVDGDFYIVRSEA